MEKQERISTFIGQHADEVNKGMFREKFENTLFDPNPKDVNDKLVFIIRPMPFLKNPNKSLVGKNVCAFTDNLGTFCSILVQHSIVRLKITTSFAKYPMFG